MSLPNQLELTPPDGFTQEETVTSFRMPPAAQLRSPMVLQFQAAARPNLIVTRRVVRAGTSVAELMSGVCADLARHVRGLSSIETTELEFEDGARGLLLKYTIPAHEKFSVLQLHSIDIEESRKEQQRMKTLGPTLAGALMLLCPFKGTIGAVKNAMTTDSGNASSDPVRGDR
jgi:hypothetical protein